MTERSAITRHEVEAQARAYLERIQRLGECVSRSSLTAKAFEEIVQRETELTIRQMRAVGRVVGG